MQFPRTLLDRLITDLTEVSDPVTAINTAGIPEIEAPQSITASDCFENSLRKAASNHLLRSFLRKYSRGDFDATLSEAALNKFLASELHCRDYNSQEARNAYVDNATVKPMCLNDRIFRRARSFIERVLGRSLPRQSELLRTCRFGPGSNVDNAFQHRDVYHKYLRWPYGCPGRALDLAFEAIQADERWYGTLESSYRDQASCSKWAMLDMEKMKRAVLFPTNVNRVTFVPKTATSLRTIAIESRIGVYLQLGVDGFIRRRLKRFGVDLDSQARNRYLALYGSLSGDLATLDLSSASDTISSCLVESLLPPQWWDYLSDLRSSQGFLPDGNTIDYEKFSSMGNGFTFALESLIFSAITFAVVPRRLWDRVSVYGDDIICPREWADGVRDALIDSGFLVNDAKSFFDGPFRESCGCDAWNGVDISPCYLKSLPVAIPDLYGLFNRLQNWYGRFHPAVNQGSLRFSDTEVGREILSHVPSGYAIWGPANAEYPDAWLHDVSFKPSTVVTSIRGIFRSSEQRFPKDIGFAKLMSPLNQLAEWGPFDGDSSSGTVFSIAGKPTIVGRTVEVFTPSIV